MIFNSYNAKDTEKFAQKLAVKMPSRIFALAGDLGAGKTTFVRAFLRSLGVKEKITSPTFLIIKNYELGIRPSNITLPKFCLKQNLIARSASNVMLLGKNYGRAYHIDCYRLNNPKELLVLDFKKIIADPQNIILIEWADKIKNLLPKKGVFWLYFKHGEKENERVLELK